MAEVDYSLPSPSDTPYRTPSSTRSRQSHFYDNMSSSSSPPPLPVHDYTRKRSSQDSIRSNAAVDESISPLDPRRFTPTLHASLVSEILSLRRELEHKTKDIERLEDDLHNTHTENERLNQTVSTTNKESRKLRHQMQLLEGGTMSALGEVAKERDEALSDASDLRRRLEQNQKRARSQDEYAEQLQSQWDRDKDKWSLEKRAMETKVNIMEGRLKVVLNEVANHQQHATQPHQPQQFRQQRTSFGESPSKRTSALSHRRQSATSNSSDHAGGRFSALGHNGGFGSNLADELAFDEEDEYQDEVYEDGRLSPDALPEELERPTSRLSIKALRILGLDTTTERAEATTQREAPRPNSRMFMFKPAEDNTLDEPFRSPPSSPVRISLATSPIMQIEIVPCEQSSAVNNSTRSDWNGEDTHSSILPDGHVGSQDQSRASFTPNLRPLMVSTSCQTVELLPSPPPTPQSASSMSNATDAEAGAMAKLRTIGTQTNLSNSPEISDLSSLLFSDVRKQPIPTIAIIPPGSRPATPETAVVLPPRTKNAGCQATSFSYSSTGIQTEDIIALKLPDLPPLMTSNKSAFGISGFSKGIAPNSSRRRLYQGMPTPPLEELPRAPVGRWGPNNDTGPLRRDTTAEHTRPVRSSSLFAGFDDDEKEDDFGHLGHDDLDDEDFFSRPTVKYTLKYGKLITQDFPLQDVDELAAADAGEAIALEHLQMSEESLRSDFRPSLSGRSSPQKGGQPLSYRQIRRIPSPKRYNIRKAALISSGTAAHSTHSSVRSSSDLVTPADGVPPPFPVPIRFSSARIGKSLSEGGRSSPSSSRASPTRKDRHRHRKPTLRKTRSGPASSPGPDSRSLGSTSANVNSRISIVAEMPTFKMPSSDAASVSTRYTYHPSEASAPRPSVATGPSRRPSHTKTNSDIGSLHSTSVVDAIAQTTVGEWMFKYVRRRKSFGVPESKIVDYDPSKNPEEINSQVTSTGVRHKRWVWLAPYERAVLWSSKQPTSNTALLGKAGRKLTIQSVLDVKDENPMPKGSTTGPHFNRSILILTPQRALKFTALTQARHYIWLTALSFLSHSPLSFNDLAALPPPPASAVNGSLPANATAGSLRRRPIRDSIRIAKGANRQGLRSFTPDGSLPVMVQDMIDREQRAIAEDQGSYDPVTDAALPPTIPRFSAHTRKRSNTAPRLPPSSYRHLGARDIIPPMPVSSNYSRNTGGGERAYVPSLGARTAESKGSSRRGSEASAISRPTLPPLQSPKESYASSVNVDGGISSTGTRTGTLASHVGDPNGTVKMDAFIETRNPQPAPPSKMGFAAGLRRIARRREPEPIPSAWVDQGRGSPQAPFPKGMEDMIGVNGIYGSTRGMMPVPHQTEVDVGSGDPFRGF